LPVARDGDKAFLVSVITPELGVDGIGDDAGGDLVIPGGGEDAGFGELARELGTRVVLLVRLYELMDAAAGEIGKVDFAVGVLAPGHDAVGRAGDFAILKARLDFKAGTAG